MVIFWPGTQNELTSKEPTGGMNSSTLIINRSASSEGSYDRPLYNKALSWSLIRLLVPFRRFVSGLKAVSGLCSSSSFDGNKCYCNSSPQGNQTIEDPESIVMFMKKEGMQECCKTDSHCTEGSRQFNKTCDQLKHSETYHIHTTCYFYGHFREYLGLCNSDWMHCINTKSQETTCTFWALK